MSSLCWLLGLAERKREFEDNYDPMPQLRSLAIAKFDLIGINTHARAHANKKPRV
jgi:hypothetical protein